MEVNLGTERERTLAIVERAASYLSALGVAAIFATFCSSKQFRTPIHRLIFYNACFNIFDITATMIGVSGPDSVGGSGYSVLCQAQGFLIQMYVTRTFSREKSSIPPNQPRCTAVIV